VHPPRIVPPAPRPHVRFPNFLEGRTPSRDLERKLDTVYIKLKYVASVGSGKQHQQAVKVLYSLPKRYNKIPFVENQLFWKAEVGPLESEAELLSRFNFAIQPRFRVY
jgi:hypothetical protein